MKFELFENEKCISSIFLNVTYEYLVQLKFQ